MASGGGGGGGWLKFMLKFCGAELLNPWSIMPAQLFDGGTSQPRRRTSPLPLPLRPLPPPPKLLGNPGKGYCLRRSLQCYPSVIKIQSVNCDWHRKQTHKDLLLQKNKKYYFMDAEKSLNIQKKGLSLWQVLTWSFVFMRNLSSTISLFSV